MSKKLTFEDACNSDHAIKRYEKVYGINTFCNVAVYKDNTIIFNQKVQIFSSQGKGPTGLRQVSIIWEEAGLGDYRTFGLYGYYSSDYYSITFQNNYLTIFCDDCIQIQIS